MGGGDHRRDDRGDMPLRLGVVLPLAVIWIAVALAISRLLGWPLSLIF